MRHATPAVLDTIEPLLARLRTLPLIERKRGTFYLKRDAFLHFHEDPSGLYADVKVAGQWQRLHADTAAQHKAVFKAAQSALRA